MTDGLLSIKYRTQSTEESKAVVAASVPRPGSYRYFVRGKNHKPEQVNAWVVNCSNAGIVFHPSYR
jgi:hypothetical protein